jgi:hypothetical protein
MYHVQFVCGPMKIIARGIQMRRYLAVFAALFGLMLGGPSAWAFTKPAFPRLGAFVIGSPQSYDDPAYQAQIAKTHYAVINSWPGWAGWSSNTTLEACVKGIKAINPNTLVFLYVDPNELSLSTSAAQMIKSKLDNEHWWVYQGGSAGSLVKSTWGNDFYITNMTQFTSKDSSGLRYIDWYAQWAVDMYYKTTPSLDGFYMDNLFWKPRVDGDWNRDGKIDSKDDPAVQSYFRQGNRAYLDALRARMPGKYQIGNLTDWDNATSLSSYEGGVNGGEIEALLGYSWSVETWGGWQEMMKAYRKILAASAEPKLVMFQQIGSRTDYKTFRYGYASALMDDGYYVLTDPAKGDYGVNWFDEFDAKLGQSITGPQSVAWQKGVYRRDFENGIVLVNPKGNGTQTITLEMDYKRIAGTQDKGVNNGQTTRSVTLGERDGIVLLRPTPKAKPKPPLLSAM